jgi:hypothetical protein
MDTRSVVGSRRRSARLTAQSSEVDRFKQLTAKKKHDTCRDTSSNSSSSTSPATSCPPPNVTSKSPPLVREERPATQDAQATKSSSDDEGNCIVVAPLFPNLPSSKAKATSVPTDEIDPTIIPSPHLVRPSLEKAVKDDVGNKWVKTARGSIRLASDSPVANVKKDTDRNSSDGESGKTAEFSTTTRRSKRLACMMPDVRIEPAEVEPLHTRRLIAIKPEPSTSGAKGPDKHQAPVADLQEPSADGTTEQDVSTMSTHCGELSSHQGKSDSPYQQRDPFQDISPILKLVADIEKIILSSPLAGRSRKDDVHEDPVVSTLTNAPQQAVPARTLTSLRALRSSTRATGYTGNIENCSSFKRTESGSSQFDGSFDDSIRKKTKAQGKRGILNTSKPFEPRGIKRSAQDLSDAEEVAPSPSTRNRRNRGTDGSKPKANLSSSNQLEAAATARDAFTADGPSDQKELDISEFEGRSDEPPQPDLLAQMEANDPNQADSDAVSTRAWDGSQCSTHERPESDRGSTRTRHGSREATPARSLEGNAHNCEDCGRVPERYLVCARCLDTIYCGRYCQLWDWPYHKRLCRPSGDAVQAQVEEQEAYLGDGWAAALELLKRESRVPGGSVESLLLGEAVRHSLVRRVATVGKGRPVSDFVGSGADMFQSTMRDPDSVDRVRANSIRVAQAAQGRSEEPKFQPN